MLIAKVALPRCVVHGTASAYRSFLSLAQHRARDRRFSTPPSYFASKNETQVKVQIGLDQHVNLSVRQPPKPEDNAPIILYLHRGLSTPHFSVPLSEELAIGANAIVVRLDYRVSKEQPYPFPIHSVLAGYDWILTHLLPPRYNITGTSRVTTQAPPRIGVCGELVGGSLATMLALTECHSEKRGAITAAAMSNPIVDWTALVDPSEEQLDATKTETNPKAKKPKQTRLQSSISPTADSNPSRTTLLSLRSQYFRKPEKYYDSFVSPLLFFRTPRYVVPGSHLLTQNPAKTRYISPDDHEETEAEAEPMSALVKLRLSHRNYPPTGSRLVLPRTRLEVGEASVLRDQGVEMVELWRRSLGRRRESVGEAASAREDNAIESVIREGSGLWGEREIREVGAWLGEALRR